MSFSCQSALSSSLFLWRCRYTQWWYCRIAME